jgi:hypothetical protein
MALGIKKYYYCTNIDGECQYALGSHIYTEQQYNNANKKCVGTHSDGCGEILTLDHINDYRKYLYSGFVVFIVIVSGSSFYLKKLFFPEPIQGISFTSGVTHVDEKVGQIELNVERHEDLDKTLSILFVSADGTAKAGHNYQALNGKVNFKSGQKLAKIPVTILPDNEISETEKVFSITLVNVEAQPHHEIFVKESSLSKEALEKSDIIVISLTNMAKDIADFARKLKITKDFISAKGNSFNESQMKTYTGIYNDIESNLKQARDRYVEELGRLQAIDRQVVIKSMDKRINYLRQHDYIQLYKAAEIMKEHFNYSLDNNVLDIDKLIIALEQTIPKSDSPSNLKIIPESPSNLENNKPQPI